ncbi:MAG: hypothetical protein HYX60_11305, partial [Legionella longbeachae]|nr:hypothetical protein [Legionella longbeachae]
MQEKIIISENKFSYNNPLSSKQHIPENEQKAYEEHTKQRIIFYSSLAMNESKEQLNNLVNEHHCAILIENQMKQIFLYQANHSIVDVSNCFIKQDVCFSWFSKLKQKGKDSWLLCEDERTIQSIAASLENREAVLYSYAQELANPLSLYPETLMSLSSLSKQGLNLFAQKRKKVLSQTLAMHKYTESAQSLLQYLQAINESGDIKLIEYVKNFFIKFDANFIEYLCHPETAPHHIMSLVNLLSLDLVLPPKLTSDLYIIPVREINSYF